ncbi:unnamed protein product [Adineta steineri]|uniref:Uncharacterized protein n=1 Tax=Adineta steineri TaxID=433720 RepID=A0A815Q6J7_9BILA|nr:unnamed protein product [Adineta steineri]CAF4042252.1 unnamed protein product [Adineta steineri]
MSSINASNIITTEREVYLRFIGAFNILLTSLLLESDLVEDNVQLTELRTPVGIVTMSLFTLSCKQIQMETILPNHDQ